MVALRSEADVLSVAASAISCTLCVSQVFFLYAVLGVWVFGGLLSELSDIRLANPDLSFDTFGRYVWLRACYCPRLGVRLLV